MTLARPLSGVLVLAIAVVWLMVSWFVAVLAPESGMAAATVLVLLVGIAVGPALLALGFHLTSGTRGAAWSLIGFGAPWAVFWALLLADSIRFDHAASTEVFYAGLVVLGLAAVATGMQLRRQHPARPAGVASA